LWGGQADRATWDRRTAARTNEDLTDLINIAIEELVHHNFELPGFTTLLEEAQDGRAEVNRALCTGVYDALGIEGRELIDRLWRDPGGDARRHGTRSNKIREVRR